MNLLILLPLAVMAGFASSSGVTIGLHPELHPIHSLYHSQDFHGQYSYGYSTPMITRNEVRSMDGMTQGGYSYMDTNGVLQTVKYTSDPIHGFQVSATNLPQDLPDVAAAKAKHLALFATIQSNHAVGAAPQVNVALPQPVQDLPEVVAARQAHMAAMEAARAGIMPQPVQDTPEVAKAKAEHLAILEATRARDEELRRIISLSPIPQNAGAPISLPAQPVNSGNSVDYRPAIDVSQYGSQGDLGLYSYGYVGPLSSQSETKGSDGVTRGGYSYIDANGKLQTVRYVADDVSGFRVQATNLLTEPSLQNIAIQDQAQETNSAQISTQNKHGVIQSNRAGFLINVDNALDNVEGKKDLLYSQQVQF